MSDYKPHYPQDGTYSSLTLYSRRSSLTLENLDSNLPSNVGAVIIRRKNNKVVLKGDLFKLDVAQSKDGGLMVQIVQLDPEATGLLGKFLF